ncbi:hypothetical protein HY948_02840 [Candidatus Gottesmanbacteria bacterium]|nr:hypothetical protein [Candidatus Gottesmanbacteria bacterium]
MRLPKKIPTLLALCLVILLIGGVSIASERFFRSSTIASGSIQPQNIAISNVTDSSFSVVWTTESPATGIIEIRGSDGKKQIFFDERDTNVKSVKKYLTHSVTGRSLAPDTTYTIVILSDGKKFQDASISSSKTAPAIPLPAGGLEPAYGTVFTAENQPAEGALVLLEIESSQTLSTIVTPSGSWMIPLNLLRTADVAQYLTTANRMTETLSVLFAGQKTSAITDTLNDSPVPMMILGKSYDFRKQQAKTEEKALLAQELPAVLGNQTAPQPTSFSVTLSSPAQDATIPSDLPLIQGTGIPNSTVAITIGITNPTSGTTTVGTDGMWRFTPETPLPPGKQSITITTPDQDGKPVAITHAFEILKSGTQVLGVATPSATLTPTFKPTPTSTATGKPVPVSGNMLPTMIVIFFGALLLTGGALTLTK